ncbi:MAG: hypothetical protein R3B46_00830 [Phycisphaerales bacterium]
MSGARYTFDPGRMKASADALGGRRWPAGVGDLCRLCIKGADAAEGFAGEGAGGR